MGRYRPYDELNLGKKMQLFGGRQSCICGQKSFLPEKICLSPTLVEPILA
jgi:hypothetical protein